MSKIKLICLLAATFTILSKVISQTWTNPLILANEWPLYNIGDPYIFKFNGLFYLYCSTRDSETGIKCWSSKDLLTWKYEGLCATDPITKSAYAPEVVYWNGTFYMYTSPAGNGHYILTASNPTGPFSIATGNLKHSIDGSVFIDDDYSWHFYNAGSNGILSCAMSTPTTLGGSFNVNACMANNWTEGPCVIKRNGIYYLIYCGNHLFSKGYRIDYATNKTGPGDSYLQSVSQNPILINSEGLNVALGHGSLFIGPDLDTYFLTYHNLAGDMGQGPIRHLNFDRIAWNGDQMLVLGPTSFAQQAPQMPTAYDYFDRTELGSSWASVDSSSWAIISSTLQNVENNNDVQKIVFSTLTANDYTAEFNLKQTSSFNNSAYIGAIFGYTDEQNYGVILLHDLANMAEINFIQNNVWGTSKFIDLPDNFDVSKWHNLKIEKQLTTYKFFIDKLLKLTINNDLGTGKIGYVNAFNLVNYSFTAFSNSVNGSGIFDVYKPLPGKIAAVHYINGGEGVGFHDKTDENTGGKYIRNDAVDIGDCADGGQFIGWNQTGEWYKYNVNVQSTSIYNAGIKYATNVSTCKIRIWQNDVAVTDVISLPTTGGFNSWNTLTIWNLNLNSGFSTLKIETIEGEFYFASIQYVKSDNSIISKSDAFDKDFSPSWNYSDGTWSIQNGEAVADGYGKKTIGSVNWSNYVVEADVKYLNTMNAGIIFRVKNPALGGAGDNSELGTDFFQGYYVGLTFNSLILGKHNYNWTQLASKANSYKYNTWYHIKVIANENNIKVYVDDMSIPKIEYTDPNPFISGKVGLRSCNSLAHFDNFMISTFTDTLVTSEKNIFDIAYSNKDKLTIFPNPVSEQITISYLPNCTMLAVYNLKGQEVFRKYNTEISTKSILNVENWLSGVYIVKATFYMEKMASTSFVKQ